MRKLANIIAVFLLVGCSSSVPEIGVRLVSRAAMPEARAAAVGFSDGKYGYILGGRDSADVVTNTLFRYVAESDSWEQIVSPPLAARVSAAAIAVEGRIYIGLGFAGKVYTGDSYLRDWWCYTPADGSWARLADYPNSYTVGVSCYTEGGNIYCIYGMGDGFTRDVIRYDIACNEWTKIPGHEGQSYAVMGGTGATVAGEHYFGTGYNTRNKNTWYRLNPEGDWEKRASVPGKRSTAVAAGTSRYIYMAGGRLFGGDLSGGKVYDDVLRYDPEQDKWYLAARMPEGRDRMSRFVIGERIFIGLGETEDSRKMKTMFEICDW